MKKQDHHSCFALSAQLLAVTIRAIHAVENPNVGGIQKPVKISVRAGSLRCESLVNPAGMDEPDVLIDLRPAEVAGTPAWRTAAHSPTRFRSLRPLPATRVFRTVLLKTGHLGYDASVDWFNLNHIGIGHAALVLEHIPHLRSSYVHPIRVEGCVYLVPQKPGASCDLI